MADPFLSPTEREARRSGSEHAQRFRGLVLACILGFAAVALYLPTVRYGFVWDDIYFVVKNPTIRTWSSWRDDFTTVSAYAAMVDARMFRPARNWSYRLDWAVAQLNPVWWHAHNTLLHAANAMLVFAFVLGLLRRVGQSALNEPHRAVAFLAALIWAFHPVQTESVCWIKSRDELLFAFFALLTLLLVLAALQRTALRPLLLFAVLLTTALALLSKEMAASLPLLVGLLAWFVPCDRSGRRFLALTAAVQIVAVGAYVLLRHQALGGTAQCDYLSGSFLTEMLTMVRAGARYVQLTVWPANLIADYTHFEPSRTVLEARWWVALGIVLATWLLAFFMRKRAPLCTLGILWFWIALLPVSNIIPTMQYLAERFLYFPLIGASLTVAGFLRFALSHEATLAQNPEEGERAATSSSPTVSVRRHTLIALVMALCVTGLAARTALRIGVWRDEGTLYAATLRDAPRNGRAYINVVMTLANRGDALAAQKLLAHFQMSRDPLLRTVNPQMLLRTEAAVATRLERYSEAARLWGRALEISPDDVDALIALGICEGNLGHHDRALHYFVEAAQRDPLVPNLRNNIAIALEMLGRHAEAQAFRRGVLAVKDIETTDSR